MRTSIEDLQLHFGRLKFGDEICLIGVVRENGFGWWVPRRISCLMSDVDLLVSKKFTTTRVLRSN